jgi:general stress protein YciG
MAESMQGQENQDNVKGSQRGRSNRGFASMDPEQQREIASKGGQAAHRQGVAHEWTSEEARAAGRKGGQASRGGGRAKDLRETDKSESIDSTSATPGSE